ncbi:MAG: hypothetical protein ACFB6S_15750 [Geminicoccaceae bacterium]
MGPSFFVLEARGGGGGLAGSVDASGGRSGGAGGRPDGGTEAGGRLVNLA